MSAEAALNFHPAVNDDDYNEDGLEYYSDGVERTITDEQVEIFRHTELFQLRLAERRKAQEDAQAREAEANGGLSESHSTVSEAAHSANMPVDGTNTRIPALNQTSQYSPPTPQPEHQTLGFFDNKAHSARVKEERRAQRNIPYDQRHKRKWESYIQDKDPAQGSRTHRRIARELDAAKEEKFDLDYDG